MTYGKYINKNAQVSIEKLREESEKAYDSLKQIVIKLLVRQGYSVERLKSGEIDNLEVDEAARNEAAGLIADDGPLGAEAVSSRIVEFAKAISGGDKSKLGMLREAVDEGFNQVKNILGVLPEVSLKTYDLIMEKLDKWENET